MRGTSLRPSPPRRGTYLRVDRRSALLTLMAFVLLLVTAFTLENLLAQTGCAAVALCLAVAAAVCRVRPKRA